MTSFINLLKEAAADPNVASIKMTLYRVAKNSQVVEALIDAAENGKEVVVMVELRARFDEQNNIESVSYTHLDVYKRQGSNKGIVVVAVPL